MGTSWTRSISVTGTLGLNSTPLVGLGNGQTILRNRFRWGFHADTSTEVEINSVVQNVISFGLVTVVGTVATLPPNPRTQSNDQAPPMQRWIYWETRAPVVQVVDQAAGVIVYRDSGSTERTDSEGQVLATGLTGGNNLWLWATWDMPFTWDPSGSGVLWGSFSTLIKT